MLAIESVYSAHSCEIAFKIVFMIIKECVIWTIGYMHISFIDIVMIPSLEL